MARPRKSETPLPQAGPIKPTIVPVKAEKRGSRPGQRSRTPDQRLRDQATISRLYLRGWNFHQIAAEVMKQYRDDPTINVSAGTVAKEMTVIRQLWRKSAADDYLEAKGKELARIDALEAAAWEAWQTSVDKGTLSEQVYQKFDERDSPRNTNRVVTRTAGAGDPRHLDTIKWCIDQRCKILGLLAPTKTQHAIAIADLTKIREERQLSRQLVEDADLAELAAHRLRLLAAGTE